MCVPSPPPPPPALLSAILHSGLVRKASQASVQNDGRSLDLPRPDFPTFAVPQPQPLSHDFPVVRFRQNRTRKKASAPQTIATTAI